MSSTNNGTTITDCLFDISELERKKIANTLHDDTSQRLALLSIELASVLNVESPEKMHEQLDKSRADIVAISEQIHRLSRVLYPSVVEHLGIVEALKTEIDNFQRRERIDVNFDVPQSVDLETYVEVSLFKIVQEALNNIALHSEAYLVHIKLECTQDLLRLVIKDNGIGFEPEAELTASQLGLKSIRARARYIGGTLSLLSEEFKGVRLELTMPLNKESLL